MKLKAKKALIIIFIGLALLMGANVLGYFFPNSAGFNYNWNFDDEESYEDISDEEKSMYLGDLKGLENLTDSDFSQIKSIKIKVATKFSKIVSSDKFSLKIDESEKKDLKAKLENGTLFIQLDKKDSFGFFSFFNLNRKLFQLSLPKNLQLEDFSIKAGVTELKLDSLEIENLNIEVGVSDLKISNLKVNKAFNFKSGVGELNLLNANIHNANFKLGIAELNFTGDLFGENKIESGIGEVNLNLARPANFYTVTSKVDLGESSPNNQSQSTEDKIEIEGGIGEVNINYANSTSL